MKKILLIILGMFLIAFSAPCARGSVYISSSDSSKLVLDNTKIVDIGDRKGIVLDNILKFYGQDSWKEGFSRDLFLKEESYSEKENVRVGENVLLTSVGSRNIADHIVISEVCIGATDYTKEYIELYNPNDSNENLLELSESGLGELGLLISDSRNEFTKKEINWSNHIIPPHGYFLLASENCVAGKKADAVFSDSMTGDSGVFITDGRGMEIDSLSWKKDSSLNSVDGKVSVSESFVTGGSIERKSQSDSTEQEMRVSGTDLGNGYDTDNNIKDFVVHENFHDPQNVESSRGRSLPFSYKSSGFLKSSIFDAGMPVRWKDLSLSKVEPFVGLHSPVCVNSGRPDLKIGSFLENTELGYSGDNQEFSFNSEKVNGFKQNSIVSNHSFEKWNSRSSPENWQKFSNQEENLGSLTIEKEDSSVSGDGSIEVKYRVEGSGIRSGGVKQSLLAEDIRPENKPKLNYSIFYNYGTNTENLSLRSGIVEIKMCSGKRLRYLHYYGNKNIPENRENIRYINQGEIGYRNWENFSIDLDRDIKKAFGKDYGTIEHIALINMENNGGGSGSNVQWFFDNVVLTSKKSQLVNKLEFRQFSDKVPGYIEDIDNVNIISRFSFLENSSKFKLEIYDFSNERFVNLKSGFLESSEAILRFNISDNFPDYISGDERILARITCENTSGSFSLFENCLKYNFSYGPSVYENISRFDGDVLAETSMKIFVRTSSDCSSWSEWRGPFRKSMIGLGSGKKRFAQYKVYMFTENRDISPVLEKIGFRYFFPFLRGSVLSPPIKTGYVTNWKLGWDGDLYDGSIVFRTRSSQKGENWTNWSEPICDGNSYDITSMRVGKKYLQVKASLYRENSRSSSPILENFRVSYKQDSGSPSLEVEDKATSRSLARISAFLSDDSRIMRDNIELFINGRRVWPEYDPQSGEVWTEILLRDGVYPIRLRAADVHGQIVEKTWNFGVNSSAIESPRLANMPSVVREPEIEVKGDLELKEKVGGFWEDTPKNPPVGIGNCNGHRLASMNGDVYFWPAYGGEPGSAGYVNKRFYRYEPNSNSWIRLENAPFGSSYGIATALGTTQAGENAIYILKGSFSGQKAGFARYTDSRGWEVLNPKIPFENYPRLEQDYPRNGSTLVWDRENYIYFFPGSSYSHAGQKDWYRYSIFDDSWEYMGELPHWNGPGNDAVYVEKNDDRYIYAMIGMYHFGDPYFGGYNLPENYENYSGVIFARYCLSSGLWEILDRCGPGSDHPYGADDGSSLVWDGSSYIYHTPGAYEETVKDVCDYNQKKKFLRYSINDGSWRELEEVPFHEYGGWDDGGGIVAVDNVIYGLKGGDDIEWSSGYRLASGGSASANDFLRYRPFVSCKAADNLVMIYRNDDFVENVKLNENGRFNSLLRLKRGTNEIRARSVGVDGRPGPFSESEAVILDTVSPRIEIDSPLQDFFHRDNNLRLAGRVRDASVENVMVSINGENRIVDVLENEFETQLILRKGKNTIEVSARDPAGNVGLVSFSGAYRKTLPDVREKIPSHGLEGYSSLVFEDHPFIDNIRLNCRESFENLYLEVKDIGRHQFQDFKSLLDFYFIFDPDLNSKGSVDNGKIAFRVESRWIESNDIAIGSLKLLKFEEGEWSSLPTEFNRKSDGWFCYTARFENLSLFAVGSKNFENSSDKGLFSKGIFGVGSEISFLLIVLFSICFSAFAVLKRF